MRIYGISMLSCCSIDLDIYRHITPHTFTMLQAQYYYIGIGRGDDTPTPLQGIAKLSVGSNPNPTPLSQWLGERGEFITEASYAPRAGKAEEGDEDDGYILAISSTPSLEDGGQGAGQSSLLVFDARDLSKGPLHRLPLPTYIPYGLHGTYIPNLTCDIAETSRKFLVGGMTLVCLFAVYCY